MTTEILVLTLVVITALGFDFTNGFHDTGNAMATSIATGALKPKTAVTLSALLNLVGAFLSVEVAVTVTKDILRLQASDGSLLSGVSPSLAMTIVFAGLIGGILWNLFTWLLGLPSSSSHALFGGLVGAGIAGMGLEGVKWDGVTAKILLPAVLSPLIAGCIAALGTALIYLLSRSVRSERKKNSAFHWGQVGTASLVSLAHGTGDAQKTMGVIALALMVQGDLTVDGIEQNGLPVWIIVSCAIAIALGTYLGGWRIIRTLGKGLVDIEPAQGMAAQASSAAIILTSSHFGMALSTTHVATGSIIGSGVGKPQAQVRWGVAARMVTAWLITLPSAGLIGALCLFVSRLIGGLAGDLVIFGVLVALSVYMYQRSRRQAVTAHNVNRDWDDNEAEPPVPASTGAAH
ncbi:inorganic phosphate transporter [Yimella sp. NH-Cas1]|uniref:inorganic phosphate transporter n=1 Tax=Yimella sp. NH-Cas1 TaxID=2917726 RepID=UPI001EFB41F4|nr:inorganic phosphate transporter [Yimella sp. NH-Cas1]MCG8655658.1 inorganic phosphate transporter [Yimella sp. NH-Cas1]